MNINSEIFREYDIRGIVGKDITNDFSFLLGKGFGTYAIRNKGKRIAISGDVRPSTESLLYHLEKGILSTGVNVVKIGIIPTPLNYYSSHVMNIDGAIQITGSHNPSDYNGFKISWKKQSFYGDKIQELKDIILNEDFELGKGVSESQDIIKDYENTIKEKINIDSSINLVMDCGNAVGGLVAPKLYKDIGVNLTELYCDVDGTFPNHHPDPTVDSNLSKIVDTIKNGNFDLGIAFDGDADRIVAIDEMGRIIRSDILMALFIPEVLGAGKNIVYDVKCSRALEETIQKHDGNGFMWKTGHSLIKSKMKEVDASFGGEMSGHIFFADNYFGFDDAIYTGLRLAQLLSTQKKKLSDLVDEIPSYKSTPELRFDCPSEEKKREITSKVVDYFSSKYSCQNIDGIRIEFEQGWGLVRSSNTQPVIVCRFEANTSEALDEYISLVLNKINELGDVNFRI